MKMTPAPLILGAILSMDVSALHAATAWDLVYAEDFNSSSRTERRDVAIDLNRRMNVMANLVPEQRPKELARLEKREAEISTATDRERSAFYESAAYQHRFMSRLLVDVRAGLDCAANETKTSTEMLCWSRVALLLSDEERIRFAVRRLQDSRRLDKDKHLPVLAQDPDVWYVTYGRGILEHIVIPYLERQAGVTSDR